MTRNEKKTHSVQMRNAREHGITSVPLSSPILAHAAREARGHSLMTAREYAAYRMDRRQVDADVAWDRLMMRRGFRCLDRGGWAKLTWVY